MSFLLRWSFLVCLGLGGFWFSTGARAGVPSCTLNGATGPTAITNCYPPIAYRWTTSADGAQNITFGSMGAAIEYSEAIQRTQSAYFCSIEEACYFGTPIPIGVPYNNIRFGVTFYFTNPDTHQPHSYSNGGFQVGVTMLCRPGDVGKYDYDSNGNLLLGCLATLPYPHGYTNTLYYSKIANWFSTLFKKSNYATGGDPVALADQSLVMAETDYANNSPFPIVWSRVWAAAPALHKWIFNYDQTAYVYPQSSIMATILLTRNDGEVISLNGTRPNSNSNWIWTIPPPSGTSVLPLPMLATISTPQDLSSVTIKNIKDETEFYQGGFFKSLTDVHGNQLHFNYDSKSRLSRIDDSAGRHLDISYPDNTTAFTYDTGRVDISGHPIMSTLYYNIDRSGEIEQSLPISVSAGSQTVTYNYQILTPTIVPFALLTDIERTDGTIFSYQYDSAKTLLSTVDETNNPYQSYTYSGSTVLTSSLGDDVDTYHFTASSLKYPNNTSVSFTKNSNGQLLSMSRPCPTCGNADGKTMTYDTFGNQTSVTDFDGHKTSYTYDTDRGLPLTMTEADGTTLSRTTSYVWDTRFQKPTQITTPTQTPFGVGSKVTTLNYDTQANLTSWGSSVSGPSGYSKTKAGTFTYNTAGQVLTETDPNGNTSSHTYDAQGNATSVSNSLGQSINLGGYNTVGNPGWMENANGLQVKMTYDARERITQIQKGCGGGSLTGGTLGGFGSCHFETTQISYTPFGSIQTLTAQNGTSLTYHYDTAHRITSLDMLNAVGIIEATGTFTMNPASEVSAVTWTDPSGNIVQQKNYTYDDLSRVKAFVDNHAKAFSHTQDDEGLTTSTSDPLLHGQVNQYDALNRLIQTTFSDGTIEKASYGIGDEVISQTDGLGHATTYTYDGFENVLSKTSPDSGTTSYTRDSNNNILTKTFDQTSPGSPSHIITQTFTYDALDRPLTATTPSGENITWTYNSCQNGSGKLCAITDHTGTTGFKYDRWGRMVEKTSVIGTHSFILGYTYDNVGQLTDTIYPSGQVAHQAWQNGNRTSLTFGGSSLVSNLQYDALQRLTGWTWSSGRLVQYHYDLDGRMSEMDGGNNTQTYLRDDAWRITGITRQPSASTSTFGYDSRNRLTSGSTWGSYTYDANTNRLTWLGSLGPMSYGVNPANNLLTSFNSNPVSYDASGNLLTKPGLTFAYDEFGRMRSSNNGSVNTVYGVNGLGERISKNRGGAQFYYVYETTGKLMGVYDSNGLPLEELVYLGDRPIATARSSGTYPIETDHLMAPIRVLDSSNNIVWSWEDREPFGTSQPNEGTVNGQPFAFNLRFPGQWYDHETGLAGNGFRDYDASLGRYVEVDPLGLSAGMNPNVYVGGNPMDGVDPYGLWSITLGGYLGPGFEVTFGNDSGNHFLTVRVGLGIGAGVSYDPFGGIPGPKPQQRCKGGIVLSASGQANFHAGPLVENVEVGVARNYNNQSSNFFGGPSVGAVGEKWGLGSSASMGGQFTEYTGIPQSQK